MTTLSPKNGVEQQGMLPMKRHKKKQDVDDRTTLNICNNKQIDVQQSESFDNSVPDSSPLIRSLHTTRTNPESTTLSGSSQIESSSKQSFDIQSSQPENSQTKRQFKDINKISSSTTIKINKNVKQRSYQPPSYKPSSGKTRHVPAHMLAPFKTSDTASFPKHTKNHSLSQSNSKIVAAKTTKSKDIKTYKTLPCITTEEHKKSSQTSDTYTNLVDQSGNSRPDSVKDTSRASHLVSTGFPVGEGLADHLPQQNSTADNNSNCSSASNLKSTDHNPSHSSDSHTDSVKKNLSPQALHKDLPESEFKKFNLQKDGSTLKLPSKLIKLVTTNKSLRNRLSTIRPVKNASSVDPAQQFVSKLCVQEEISKELRARVSALTCLRSHCILLDVLQSLQLDQISESTSLEVLYKAKRNLEFVLTTFSDLQEEADYFSQAKYRQLPTVLDVHAQERDDQMPSWLFTGLHIDAPNDLWNHLQTSKCWAHKQFTETYLQLNIFLTKAAEKEWWKILTSQDRDPTVFQGVYGLLTSHGQFLPALLENPHYT